MNFLIITHADHKLIGNKCLSYAPYVREMNLWIRYVNQVEIVAPLIKGDISNIDLAYEHDNLKFSKIPSIALTSIITIIVSGFKLPKIIYSLFTACYRADHIHLRCPGNIGLLGCFVQFFFPKKLKTAKYAGNWDFKSKQPISYKLQKRILSSTFLTKNCKVLVYGKWENQTKNIKPFFTASFHETEKVKNELRDYSKALNFIFIGSLVKGKRPLMAIKIVEGLKNQKKDVKLNIYGEGILRTDIENYIQSNNLEGIVILHGNQKKEAIKKVLRTSHFLLLLSKSEGWPKAIAEAMFFGVVPISTSISCVPYMLDNGNRGILVKPNISEVIKKIDSITNDEYIKMSNNAISWSQYYTLDKFEEEVKKLLNN